MTSNKILVTIEVISSPSRLSLPGLSAAILVSDKLQESPTQAHSLTVLFYYIFKLGSTLVKS